MAYSAPHHDGARIAVVESGKVDAAFNALVPTGVFGDVPKLTAADLVRAKGFIQGANLIVRVPTHMRS